MQDVIANQTPAPATEAPAAPSMSALGTLLGVFTNPRRTFEALAVRPRILAPIVAVLICQLLFGIVIARTDIIKNDALAKLEQRGAPQEQIDATERVLESPARYLFTLLGAPVVVFILLFSAGLLYFVANLMMGARLRYTHYLSIAAYGGVIAMVDQLAQLLLAVQRGTFHVHLGVGAFLGDELTAPLRMLDAATDPLLLWSTAIEALGVAVMARKRFGFGVLAVAPWFVARTLLAAFGR